MIGQQCEANAPADTACHLGHKPSGQSMLAELEPAQCIGSHRFDEQRLGVHGLRLGFVACKRDVLRANANDNLLPDGWRRTETVTIQRQMGRSHLNRRCISWQQSPSA